MVAIPEAWWSQIRCTLQCQPQNDPVGVQRATDRSGKWCITTDARKVHGWTPEKSSTVGTSWKKDMVIKLLQVITEMLRTTLQQKGIARDSQDNQLSRGNAVEGGNGKYHQDNAECQKKKRCSRYKWRENCSSYGNAERCKKTNLSRPDVNSVKIQFLQERSLYSKQNLEKVIIARNEWFKTDDLKEKAKRAKYSNEPRGEIEMLVSYCLGSCEVYFQINWDWGLHFFWSGWISFIKRERIIGGSTILLIMNAVV